MKTTLESEIVKLKKEKYAVILAHNYQLPDVQDIADFTGDSLELSRIAARTDAEVIVFCGVRFMAETAAILSPQKTVLLPVKEAGCPMADMITADQLRQLKKEHPGATVICYVNSTAEVKAESDYCCTSANAEAVVRAIPETEEIIFVPDKNLGQYVSLKTGRNLILWPGFCASHIRILPEDIKRLKNDYNDALVMVHPECSESVRNLADEILSTGGMLKLAQQSDISEFIVGTELGILHRLRKENPAKHFYQSSEAAVCFNMKRIETENILWSLQTLTHKIEIPLKIAEKANISIERMLSIFN